MNELVRMALEVAPEEMDQLTPRERRTIGLIKLTVAVQNRMASGVPFARMPKKESAAGGKPPKPPKRESIQQAVRARAQRRRVRGAKEGGRPAGEGHV